MLHDITMKDMKKIEKDYPSENMRGYELNSIRSGQGFMMMTQNRNEAIEALMYDAHQEEIFEER